MAPASNSTAMRDGLVAGALALVLHAVAAVIVFSVFGRLQPELPPKKAPTRVVYVPRPPAPAQPAAPDAPSFVISSPPLDPPFDSPAEIAAAEAAEVEAEAAAQQAEAGSSEVTDAPPVEGAPTGAAEPLVATYSGNDSMIGDYGDVATARALVPAAGPNAADAGTEVLTFRAGMTPPSCDSAAGPIDYPPEARAARVTGTMLLRCQIFADGSVRNCAVEKDLPFMAEPALAAVTKWRCAPATLNGQPVNVEMTLPVNVRRP